MTHTWKQCHWFINFCWATCIMGYSMWGIVCILELEWMNGMVGIGRKSERCPNRSDRSGTLGINSILHINSTSNGIHIIQESIHFYWNASKKKKKKKTKQNVYDFILCWISWRSIWHFIEVHSSEAKAIQEYVCVCVCFGIERIKNSINFSFLTYSSLQPFTQGRYMRVLLFIFPFFQFFFLLAFFPSFIDGLWKLHVIYISLGITYYTVPY